MEKEWEREDTCIRLRKGGGQGGPQVEVEGAKV